MAIQVWRYDSELSWFFSDGQSAFERSTFGALLERAEQFGFDHDGHRIPHPETKRNESWHFRQGLCGQPAVSIDQALADDIRQLIDWEALDPSITACPKPIKSEEPSVTPDDWKLQRYARASRALNNIPSRYGRVLSLYYGLRGCFWELQKLGRILAVMHETQAGKKLLEVCKSDGELRSDERIAAAWDRQRAWPDDKIGALLTIAEKQAHKVLRDAKRSYEAARN